jgi:hypothetical protein
MAGTMKPDEAYRHIRYGSPLGKLPAQQRLIESVHDALQLARDLNEADEPNHEYARGQANLIADMFGLQPHHTLLMRIIQHRIGFSEGISQPAERIK